MPVGECAERRPACEPAAASEACPALVAVIASFPIRAAPAECFGAISRAAT
jgi:hypothetical protein